MNRGVMTFQYSHRLLRPQDRRVPMPPVSISGCRAHPTASGFRRPSGPVRDTGAVISLAALWRGNEVIVDTHSRVRVTEIQAVHARAPGTVIGCRGLLERGCQALAPASWISLWVSSTVIVAGASVAMSILRGLALGLTGIVTVSTPCA